MDDNWGYPKFQETSICHYDSLCVCITDVHAFSHFDFDLQLLLPGLTDDSGLISLRNFTIDGPGGLYTLLPSAGGVDAPEEAVMLVSTPVASLEVVDDTLHLGFHKDLAGKI